MASASATSKTPADNLGDGPTASPSAPPNPSVSRSAPQPPQPSRKEPPPEKPADIRRRTFVITSFWLIVVFLGLPIWWNTTSIVRSDLPLQQMKEWADGSACRPVFPLRIALDAPALPEPESHALLRLTQHALDDLNDFQGHHLRLEPASPASSGGDDKGAALTVRLSPADALARALHPHAHILDVSYPPSAVPLSTASSSALATYIATELRAAFTEEQAIISYLLAQSAPAADHASHSRGPSPEVSEAISKRMTRSLKYSRTYHLTFSLFTDGFSPSSWDIEAAIDEYMRPILQMLGPIHNFTIDTQVQLYAAPGVQSQVLTKEDLSSFINAAEWPLSPSIGGAPTVNFVLYAGNQTVSLGPDSDTSRSWLVPQWGSVYLLPPPAAGHVPVDLLKQPLKAFTSHLLSLLGTPESGSLPLRLSTLNRVRSADLLLRASSTLGSLARLSLALSSISIPSSVAEGVSKSMQHLQLACSTLGSTESLEYARIAHTEAERAFFEKSMVGQLYFPDEHKIAVYLPLLGPVGVPLVIGLLNEIRAWKNRRAAKVKAA